jgi:hypothetical protein
MLTIVVARRWLHSARYYIPSVLKYMRCYVRTFVGTTHGRFKERQHNLVQPQLYFISTKLATLGFDVHESEFNHLITSFEVLSKIFRGKTADEGSREEISAIVPTDVACLVDNLSLAALYLTSNDTEAFVDWDTDTDLSNYASAQVLYDERGNSDSDDEKNTDKEWSFFDKGGFYDSLRAYISEDSIAVLLTAMQTTISEVGQKKKGSVLPDEKAMSLKGRWF